MLQPAARRPGSGSNCERNTLTVTARLCSDYEHEFTATTDNMKRSSSTEFLLISECVNRIVQGMWGNTPRPEPVREIKRFERDLSVGFGPRKERAAALLRTDALRAALPIYVRQRSTAATQGRSAIEPGLVPPEFLKRVVPARGGLPDHPTHVRRNRANDGPDVDALLFRLRQGELVVRRSDFSDWYKEQRSKGRWPSQNNKTSRRGRPAKDPESLRNAILALVHDGVWRAADGMERLRRLLIKKGHEPPSSWTLARVMDRLFHLTGEPSLRRKERKSPAAQNALASCKNRNLFRIKT
jgi:hypothetical protein